MGAGEDPDDTVHNDSEEQALDRSDEEGTDSEVPPGCTAV
jgi:hypothetical protein